MDRTKKVLITLLVVGALATVGVGTYATFTAQTTNANNTVTTGSLVLSNTVNAPSTACFSTGGGSTDTNSNNCAAFFTLGPLGPGGSGSTATLQLKNVGSLGASSAVVFAPSCASAANGSYSGTGNLCSVLDFYIQETDSSGTPTSCTYGGGTATTCAFDNAHTVSSFTASHSTSGGGLALGALPSGQTNYYTIGVLVDSGAGNSMQGQQATFSLSWFASY